MPVEDFSVTVATKRVRKTSAAKPAVAKPIKKAAPARKAPAKTVAKKTVAKKTTAATVKPIKKTTAAVTKATVKPVTRAAAPTTRAKKAAVPTQRTPAKPNKKVATAPRTTQAVTPPPAPVKRTPRRKPLLELVKRPDGRPMSFTERLEEKMHKQLGHKGPVCHLCRTNASRLALAAGA